ncbi:MAG: hypothetical protein WBQ94_03790 [Terracidiphilus sp.]
MRHALVVMILFCSCGFASYSQTADELIAKNIEARGGLEKIKLVKLVRITSKIAGGEGFTIAAGQENQRPNLIWETHTLQGMTAESSMAARAGMQAEEDRVRERD